MADARAASTPHILANASERFGKTTEQMSSIARTLGIAGVGVVWLFAGGATSPPSTVVEVVAADALLGSCLLLSVAALTLDALQYLWGAATWGSFSWALGRVWETREEVPGARRMPWLAAAIFGIDAIIYEAAEVPPGTLKPSWVEASAEDRRKIILAEMAEPSESLLKMLAEPRAPGYFSLGTGLLFWLKAGALVASYIAVSLYIAGIAF